MEGQSVVVIHDASRELNLRVFEWTLHGLLLMAGDMLTLIVVLHEVITPMGYKSSVDSRLMSGANQKIVEAQAARKKEEYMNNVELAQIFKVEFKIEMAIGSSLKAVAMKSATKLKATWLILDRKMKNDEEYFLRKLSCGILRIRRFNKIVRLRGPLKLPQETRPGSTHETYTDSIPLPDTSTEPDLDHSSIEISPTYYPMKLEQALRQESLHDEAECSTPNQLSTGEKDIRNKQLECQGKSDQQWKDEELIESRNHVKERDQKLKQKEENRDMTCVGSNMQTTHESLSTEEYQRSESCSSLGGAKNYYLGGAEEYTLCKQFFGLSNFHLRD
ncbi:uncharacterized protein LOC113874533 [Abrus precatorius]|uniref:Uncharacterized protein LOC113874533 n=1 Tax=Abrus precatorius TaxID=3816 RepID=A0A8B8MIZ2_ABRPR|nr:uncharacterized protein LOC113874533 [Abrus precatorius]